MQVAPELHTNAPFSHIQFSADGKLMLCVAEGHVYQLDAFNGTLQQTYNTGVPPGALGLSAIFSPDSNYILSGWPLLLGYGAWLVEVCIMRSRWIPAVSVERLLRNDVYADLPLLCSASLLIVAFEPQHKHVDVPLLVHCYWYTNVDDSKTHTCTHSLAATAIGTLLLTYHMRQPQKLLCTNLAEMY